MPEVFVARQPIFNRRSAWRSGRAWVSVSREFVLDGLAASMPVTALDAGDFARAQKLVGGAGALYIEALACASDAARPLFERIQAAAA
jgi:hypothetical protein